MLSLPAPTLAALALLLIAASMTAVFLLALRLRNFSVVDVAWSLNFSLLALLYAAFAQGFVWRRVVVAALVASWSLRLGIHLWRRVAALHPEEEGRYVELRREWASGLEPRFFAFFQLQGLLNVVLSAPLLIACADPRRPLGPFELAGALLLILALVGESAADRQLDRFRQDPANRGRSCRVGLWRYSRHPNYFFEWLVWVAFFVFALPSPWGWTTLACPALMLYFLLRVTGIPATEAQALRSRGDDYREYQRTTSAFFPWPPRAAGR
jgi:steroid 5-alpha reductase family enzyme